VGGEQLHRKCPTEKERERDSERDCYRAGESLAKCERKQAGERR